MLAKKNRADTKTVQKIFKEGKFINSLNVSFKFILTRGQEIFGSRQLDSSLPAKKTSCPRISVIVPKTVAKLAVKRNLLRRRGYAALAGHIESFPTDVTGVFIFKRYQDDVHILENEIKNILGKVH